MFTWENTWKDLADAGTKIAVLPIGATEQHGTNLPLGADTLITTHVAEAIAEKFDGYLVPTIPVGTSETHLSFPGTLTLQHQTLAAVISDLVDSLARTGFTTVIIVSMHYGNYVVWSEFIDGLGYRYPGLTLVVMEPRQAWEEAAAAAGISTEELHAGEGEASLVASLRPDLVGPSPTDFPHPRRHVRKGPVTETGFPQDVRQVSPMGALGEPSLGSREKGERFWEVFLARVIADLRDDVGVEADH